MALRDGELRIEKDAKKEPLVDAELARTLDVAKRILTKETQGAVIIFESNPHQFDEGKTQISGFMYANDMHKMSVLHTVLRTLDLPKEAVDEVVDRYLDLE